MKLKISQIKIKDRFRQDLGDVEELMRSIGEVGLMHPIVVQKDTHRLIAGERRLEACKRLKMIEVPVTILNIKEIAMGEFHENMQRKDFTLPESVKILAFIEKWMGDNPEHGAVLNKDGSKRVRENAAKFMGMSHGTLQKMIEINRAVEADPDKHAHILKDIEGGQSISYAHKSMKNVVRQDNPTPALPEDEFDLIELDPPWAYDLALVGSPPYKTMTLEEMQEEIPTLPAHKDCIMFMWSTNPKLEEAMALMRFYGFEYKTNFCWGKFKNGKVQAGNGYYALGAHELLLVGVKGAPGVPGEKVRVPSLQLLPRTQHSQKPDLFYNIIDTYYPGKKKLSMFSRRKRDGWTTWGDEEAVAETA